MRSAQSVGRMIGMMLLVQLAGLIVPFILLHPMTTRDFLANAAGFSFQIKLAVVLLLANCALTIGISIAAFPVIRRHSDSMALLLVVASVILFLLQAVDNVHLLSMLSMSQQSIEAGGPSEILDALATTGRATRKWAHYTTLAAIDAWIFLFYTMLFRFRLVPRALAIFGLSTVVLHFAVIPVPVFLGYRGVTMLGAVIAVSHLALVVWLLTRGLAETPVPENA